MQAFGDFLLDTAALAVLNMKKSFDHDARIKRSECPKLEPENKDPYSHSMCMCFCHRYPSNMELGICKMFSME
jgi:hypothetical protein